MRISAFTVAWLAALSVWAAPVSAATPSAATLASTAPRVSVPTERVAAANVYAGAVLVAQRGYPSWATARHVVIASGEAGAVADTLVAASLCWAYDAPLLLTGSASLPPETRAALKAIVSANTSVTVHIVGSSETIPQGLVTSVRSIVGANVVEQPWRLSGRYALPTAVARRVAQVAEASGRTIPSAVLVVNVNGNTRLLDGPAAAAVSRHTGIPVLFTSATTVPTSTGRLLSERRFARVIAVGGTKAVSATMYRALGATERWGGPSRYATSVSIASHALALGWSDDTTFAVAASLSSARLGAYLVGREGGVLLITGRVRAEQPVWAYLAGHNSQLTKGYVVGGASVASSQLAELNGAPGKPWFDGPIAASRYVGRTVRVTGHAGGNTATVALYVDGVSARTETIHPWSVFAFPAIRVASGRHRVAVVAVSQDSQTATALRTVERLRYPDATCIVIDKSEYKLYWVKGNRLVKAYPVAIGRSSMETPAPSTWKILQKYRTSWGGVSGPRKMRLFRLRSGHYVRTRYGIHGTNQEWVIGTKASHGCIRMYNRDVLELYPQVPLGTMVHIRP